MERGAATNDGSPGITIGFHGYGPDADAAAARAFEDEVLALLVDHGGRVLFRGTRAAGQPETEPLELHVLWFPDQATFDAYLADERRLAVIERHGAVFADKRVVLLDPVTDG